MQWRWEGTAHVFGDDVPNDEGVMPLRMVRAQEYDPKVLARHCFEPVAPGRAARIRPGDLVIGGRDFAHGNPHIQGFLGLRGLGVAVLCESMARGPLRAAINAGVPVLVAPGIGRVARDGERLVVDFERGEVLDPESGARLTVPGGLAPIVREIVAAGGGLGHMRQRLGLGRGAG